MALINQPSAQPVDTLQKAPDGSYFLASINQGWRTFLNAVFDLLNGSTQNGPTANRPKPLWIGQPFFDTTLNKPIFVSKDGVTWVDATGTPA